MMQNFRSKPVEVRAMQFTDTQAGMKIIDNVKEWCVRVTGSQRIDINGHLIPILLIETETTTMQVNLGQWVVIGMTQGDIQVVTDLAFEEGYEAVSAEVPQ